MVKPVKGPSKRILLAKAVRAAVAPVMKGWGFANPPKGMPDWYQASRLDTWVRNRDGFTDEIYLEWFRNGDPFFYVEFMTDQIERMRTSKAVGKVPRLRPMNCLSWKSDTFGYQEALFGGFGGIEKNVREVLERLDEVNQYLVTGITTRHIQIKDLRQPNDDPTIDYPAFWWREGGPDAYRARTADPPKKPRRKPSAKA